ncbi:zinc-ribbon domain containing protein [Oscillospiraceae bacterium PP1C4]
MNQDKTLTCKDCGAEFVFTASEQDFYAEKGFTNLPVRCKDCRSARKNNDRNNDRNYGSSPRREMYPAVCAACGKDTQVPFQPRDDRPVYCSDCFSRQR